MRDCFRESQLVRNLRDGYMGMKEKRKKSGLRIMSRYRELYLISCGEP